VSDTSGPSARTGLKRSLTLTHAVLYGLGVTIGAGIYVLVGLAAGRSGLSAPLAFVLAAFMLSFSAATFAELGTRMPVAASEAAYVKAAFGNQPFSLAVGLLVVVTAMISGATISVGSSGYIGVLVGLSPKVLIAVVVILMGAIACLSTSQSVSLAGVMTLVETGGLALIIGAGLFAGEGVVTRIPEIWPGPSSDAWMSIGATSLVAVFAFIGFEHLVNISEEMKDPRRTLPRALFATLIITALLYALVVWIAVITVPPAELAQSSAPLALVFERLTGLPLITMSIIAAVATLNGVVVHMIMIGRVLYGLSQAGALPRGLSRVTGEHRVPLVATLVGIAAILVLALAVPLEGLANITSALTLAVFAVVNVALITLHRSGTDPDGDYFRAPRWVPYAGLVASVLLFLVSLIPH
jgi:APA family basic amino acid/polyamine antiporter